MTGKSWLYFIYGVLAISGFAFWLEFFFDILKG